MRHICKRVPLFFFFLEIPTEMLSNILGYSRSRSKLPFSLWKFSRNSCKDCSWHALEDSSKASWKTKIHQGILSKSFGKIFSRNSSGTVQIIAQTYLLKSVQEFHWNMATSMEMSAFIENFNSFRYSRFTQTVSRNRMCLRKRS